MKDSITPGINEELAQRIQAGETNLYPELWDNTYKLLYMLAHRYYTHHAAQCERAGIIEEDLRQECFIVMTKAVRAYRPEAGYTLSAYFALQCKMIFGAACGLRRRDPLNDSASLDTPLKTSDHDDATLADTITGDQDIAEDITEKLYIDRLRIALEQALSLLPETERECVKSYYLRERSYNTIATERGMTSEETYRCVKRGVQLLGRGRASVLLRGYAADIIDCYAYSSSYEKWRQTGTSSTERAAMKLIDIETRRF
jgi:RNA polymerase sigma factor, sigma-70 family